MLQSAPRSEYRAHGLAYYNDNRIEIVQEVQVWTLSKGAGLHGSVELPSESQRDSPTASPPRRRVSPRLETEASNRVPTATLPKATHTQSNRQNLKLESIQTSSFYCVTKRVSERTRLREIVKGLGLLYVVLIPLRVPRTRTSLYSVLGFSSIGQYET